MPLQKLRWTGSQWRVFQGMVPSPVDFTPGVDMPVYVPTIGFTGAKNIGNLPGVPLTLYQGTQGVGILQINSPTTFDNIDFGNRQLDIRANCIFNNCRGVLTDVQGTSPDHVRLLNGTGMTSTVFNDCEFHNRAQYIMNGINGRNYTANRTVVTGHVDGMNNANTGGAPIIYQPIINDCWIGDTAWWAANGGATGIVHPSDDQTHNDGSQTSEPAMTWDNCFFGMWPSEWVGTGTPNSGSETNPHGAPYIYTQATMNSLRTSFMTVNTRADQSFGGISRKSTTGGSFAGIMGTLSAGGALVHNVDHCWFSGGTVHINYTNANLTGNVGHIYQSTFWNDMTAGHTHPTTVKGTAIYVKSGLTYDIPTTGANANHWFDGTVVSPTFL